MNESGKSSIKGFVYQYLPVRPMHKFVKLCYVSPDRVIATKSNKPEFFVHGDFPDSTFVNALLESGSISISRIPAEMTIGVDGKKDLEIYFLKADVLELQQ